MPHGPAGLPTALCLAYGPAYLPAALFLAYGPFVAYGPRRSTGPGPSYVAWALQIANHDAIPKKVSDWSAGLLTDVTSCRFAMENFCGIVTSCPVRTTTKGAETSALRLSTLLFAILIATIHETNHDDYRRESVLYDSRKLPESIVPQI